MDQSYRQRVERRQKTKKFNLNLRGIDIFWMTTKSSWLWLHSTAEGNITASGWLLFPNNSTYVHYTVHYYLSKKSEYKKKKKIV